MFNSFFSPHHTLFTMFFPPFSLIAAMTLPHPSPIITRQQMAAGGVQQSAVPLAAESRHTSEDTSITDNMSAITTTTNSLSCHPLLSPSRSPSRAFWGLCVWSCQGDGELCHIYSSIPCSTEGGTNQVPIWRYSISACSCSTSAFELLGFYTWQWTVIDVVYCKHELTNCKNRLISFMTPQCHRRAPPKRTCIPRKHTITVPGASRWWKTLEIKDLIEQFWQLKIVQLNSFTE